jgi:hypothetical protein
VNATLSVVPTDATVIATLVAAPAASAKLLEVAAVRDAGVKVSMKFPAVPVIRRLVNVATPATAVAVVVPESVPVPEAIDATTLPVNDVTVLSPESVTRTTGWVVKADPLTAPDGWVVIIALVAAPTWKVKVAVALVVEA